MYQQFSPYVHEPVVAHNFHGIVDSYNFARFKEKSIEFTMIELTFLFEEARAGFHINTDTWAHPGALKAQHPLPLMSKAR